MDSLIFFALDKSFTTKVYNRLVHLALNFTQVGLRFINTDLHFRFGSDMIVMNFFMSCTWTG